MLTGFLQWHTWKNINLPISIWKLHRKWKWKPQKEWTIFNNSMKNVSSVSGSVRDNLTQYFFYNEMGTVKEKTLISVS